MNPLYDAIFRGMAPLAKNAVQASLDEGKSPQDIIDESMIPAMEAIGKEFEAGRVFVPNLLLSARAMKTALDILKPLMLADQTTTLGTVVIGTVKGDLHDIGKNLVASMLEGRGFKAAPEYAGNELKKGVGGGVCQASTTLYNACIMANCSRAR